MLFTGLRTRGLRSCFEDIIKPTQQILQALADFFAEGALETSLAEDPSKKRSVTWVRMQFHCLRYRKVLLTLLREFRWSGSMPTS